LPRKNTSSLKNLQTIPITWPFAIWGLNLIGKLMPALEGFDHFFVMIDKFTKWIKAKHVATASSEAAVKFIKEVINRYGLMNMIITDNGTQFTGTTIINLCDEQQINIRWATVAHPKTNGQVERANGCIL
jgi:transposase InsO family protein